MKKMNLSMIAVLVATALAFAGSKEITFPGEQNEQWFQLSVGGDPSDPNDYTLVGSAPSGCDGGLERCAIYAPEDMDNIGKPTVEGVESPSDEVLRASR